VTAREKETEKETIDEGIMGSNDSFGEMVNRIQILIYHGER